MTVVELDFDAVMAASGELARYQIPGGERVVLAHPSAGGAEILDVPASGVGDSHVVDRGYTDAAVLHAFVAEYVRHARLIGCCPMGREALDLVVDGTGAKLAEAFAENVGIV
jgi:hypothetical protein